MTASRRIAPPVKSAPLADMPDARAPSIFTRSSLAPSSIASYKTACFSVAPSRFALDRSDRRNEAPANEAVQSKGRSDEL